MPEQGSGLRQISVKWREFNLPLGNFPIEVPEVSRDLTIQGGIMGPMNELKALGRPTEVPTTPAPEILEAFDNPRPGRDYQIAFDCPEFTCVCPITGQPDFARVAITYVPDLKCVELKSLKLYLMSFRNAGTFHEAVTNRIADDLAALTTPRALRVVAEFSVRGGIQTTVSAGHGDLGLLDR